VGFNQDRFKGLLDLVLSYDVPVSHTVVFYYCSTDEASRARKSGLPALKRFNGVPFTLRRPHLTTKNDFAVFNVNREHDNGFPHEVVLLLSLPRRLLDPLKGFENDEGLCMISADLLKALRPSSVINVVDRQPWLNNLVLLSPYCIVRSLLIMEKDSILNMLTSEELNILSDISITPRVSELISVDSIETYVNAMSKIRLQLDTSEALLLYHYTTTAAANLIIKKGIRFPLVGAGGVYLTTQGPCSYELHTSHYETNLIKDWVGIERLQELKGKGNFDAVIVYQCNAKALQQVFLFYFVFLNIQY
jgi:hypothetical protein